MPSYLQLPATCDLQFIRGDELPFTVQFPGRDLTGYTLTSGVYVAGTEDAFVVQTPTLEVNVTTTNGVPTTAVTVVLVETQTAALSIFNRYRWFLKWVSPGGLTRTLLAGNCIAGNP